MGELIVGTYFTGILLLTFLTFVGALAAVMNDDPPRTVFGDTGRRFIYSVLWPVALPAYLIRAVRRNEW